MITATLLPKIRLTLIAKVSLAGICILLNDARQNQAECQSGPAGVGSASTNIVWFSADKKVYRNAGTTAAANGDTIQQWQDRSGNNFTASQTTSSYKPLYKTNIVNGLPVIRFDGNDDRMLATGVTSSSTLSMWVVASAASYPTVTPGLIQGSPAGLAFSSTSSNKSMGMWVQNTGEVYGRGVQANGTVCNVPLGTTLSANTFYSLMASYNGTTTIQQYVNNAASSSVAYNGTLKSWSDFGIGHQGTESWNGDIAEIIVYNFSVNLAQRIIVDNYLAAKYNLTLASNDIYTMDNLANGNYDYEVAGIGQASDGSRNSDGKGSGVVRMTNPRGLGNDEFLFWGHNNGALGTAGVNDRPAGVSGRLARVWRASEKGEVGNVDILFDLSSLGPVTATDLRLLIDADNNGNFNNESVAGGGIISGAISMGSNVYEFANVNINSNMRFTVGSTNLSTTPLPIKLEKFEAVKTSDEEVKFEWVTASEQNTDYFVVQRSADAKIWSDVLKKEGAGNSDYAISYSGYDNDPAKGISYYRLKQIDLGGEAHYSAIHTIRITKSDWTDQVTVYPNPAQENFNVRISAPGDGDPESGGTISVINELGQLMQSLRYETNGSDYTVDTSHYRAGTYFVKIDQGNSSTVKKIMLAGR